VKKNLTVKSVEELTSLLGLLAEASVKEVLSEMSPEKQTQDQMSDELDDFRAPAGSNDEKDLDDEEVEEAEDDEEGEDSEAKKKDTTKLGSANPEPQKPSTPSSKEVMGADLGGVVKSLNKIRSGKSLKDEMTKRELNDYLKSLSDGERQSLYVFLDGLSQIMAGGVSGDQAPDPGAVGITVNATTKIKDPGKKDGKRPATSPAAVASNDDGSNQPKPIIVGEVANKAEVMRIARRLMKD